MSGAVSPEVAEVNRLLTSMMRERKVTQIDIQESMGWGRSYLSQVMTGQKKFRLQVLFDVLRELEVSPADFFRELYGGRDVRLVSLEIEMREMRLRVGALERANGG